MGCLEPVPCGRLFPFPLLSVHDVIDEPDLLVLDDLGADLEVLAVGQPGPRAGLRLDHRKRRQRPPTADVGQLCSTFQQPRVEIEDIAGVRLTAGWAAQYE